MSIDEIVHTCSNENVANAAVASIGVSFVGRIKSTADLLGLSVGAFTAHAVRAFAEEAPVDERREVLRAMFHADQPLLLGLKAILERELEETGALGRSGWGEVTPALVSGADAAATGCCSP